MPLDPTAEHLLAAVQASPRAVAAHDKIAWVGLFADDAAVHDPVGSRAHVGRAAIARFYDTFIGPNSIAFQVDRDLVAGQTVVRDLHIETTMSTGATVTVPMHLRYDLVDTGDGWRIARLAAHWELPAMIARLLRTGVPGLLAGAKLGPQLVANLGVDGAMGMMRALRSVGRSGKRAARQLFEAAAGTDIGRVRALLGEHAVVEFPAGNAISVEEFTNRARAMRWDKLIAAGRTVSASVRLDESHGVAFVEFEASGPRITGVTVFLDANL
ncbi:nuclear transport factor 2 family protein [Nocardia amikacinitolerans]|uniref:nuclear transport factor 2 family protein n=1 Tax=Nocardia amikacinitolerans TaxID=756689 RepID=UPI0020A4163C|nr:nuclear transport factor 2 family protein [Nocardia amikacinitolerans]MCP2274692.1 Ketosteroid isomerase homolog [Nocardia amikacinitolerans]